MTASNFTASLEHVLKSEGGFVNDPQDPGGMTNLGVTKRVWEEFVGHEVDEADMRALTPDTVAPLYKRQYWDACQCDAWPTGVDYVVFDTSVNQGVGRAIRTLQTAAGVNPDGQIGPATKAAVADQEAVTLIDDIIERREQFYRGLSTFPRFGRGWLNRLADVKATAHSMV